MQEERVWIALPYAEEGPEANWPKSHELLLGQVALAAKDAAETQRILDSAVYYARMHNISWKDIAGAAGISYQEASRRWSREARDKRSANQRTESQPDIEAADPNNDDQKNLQ